jgi:DNA-directed RNA polymerase beta subunit
VGGKLDLAAVIDVVINRRWQKIGRDPRDATVVKRIRSIGDLFSPGINSA